MCRVYCCTVICYFVFFFFKQKTAYEMRISDWSSDVCSSDLRRHLAILADRHDLAARRVFERGHVQPSTHPRGGAHVGATIEYARERVAMEIGRASCRERVCQYV